MINLCNLRQFAWKKTAKCEALGCFFLAFFALYGTEEDLD